MPSTEFVFTALIVLLLVLVWLPVLAFFTTKCVVYAYFAAKRRFRIDYPTEEQSDEVS